MRVAEILRGMIEEMKASFRAKDTAIVEHVSECDNQVDILHNAIIPFLAKLSQEELTQEQSDRCIDYIYIQNELESIGDLIDKNVMNLAHKKIDQNLIFSEEGFHELEHLMYRINRNFELLMHAFEDEDISYSKEVLDFHKKKEEEKYKKLHIERLHKGMPETIATSSVHLDLITYLSRINTHIAFVAKRINSAFAREGDVL